MQQFTEHQATMQHAAFPPLQHHPPPPPPFNMDDELDRPRRDTAIELGPPGSGAAGAEQGAQMDVVRAADVSRLEEDASTDVLTGADPTARTEWDQSYVLGMEDVKKFWTALAQHRRLQLPISSEATALVAHSVQAVVSEVVDVVSGFAIARAHSCAVAGGAAAPPEGVSVVPAPSKRTSQAQRLAIKRRRALDAEERAVAAQRCARSVLRRLVSTAVRVTPQTTDVVRMLASVPPLGMCYADMCSRVNTSRDAVAAPWDVDEEPDLYTVAEMRQEADVDRVLSSKVTPHVFTTEAQAEDSRLRQAILQLSNNRAIRKQHLLNTAAVAAAQGQQTPVSAELEKHAREDEEVNYRTNVLTQLSQQCVMVDAGSDWFRLLMTELRAKELLFPDEEIEATEEQEAGAGAVNDAGGVPMVGVGASDAQRPTAREVDLVAAIESAVTGAPEQRALHRKMLIHLAASRRKERLRGVYQSQVRAQAQARA
eukprot:CAMPEP_0196778474 /NCGR_PEP_ID=MMETSP1104-20130614/5815_1 /TAXON_ID=33652 /ORGANISM="Cafeteria sp., Strain Caron Lab Isolate" /LENGTH=482 /DNA_ID=CAMNT_0042148643 /DNA_START=62 /DNA_END=1506 /DNA_ORIENTATION=+